MIRWRLHSGRRGRQSSSFRFSFQVATVKYTCFFAFAQMFICIFQIWCQWQCHWTWKVGHRQNEPWVSVRNSSQKTLSLDYSKPTFPFSSCMISLVWDQVLSVFKGRLNFFHCCWRPWWSHEVSLHRGSIKIHLFLQFEPNQCDWLRCWISMMEPGSVEGIWTSEDKG